MFHCVEYILQIGELIKKTWLFSRVGLIRSKWMSIFKHFNKIDRDKLEIYNDAPISKNIFTIYYYK